MLRSGSHIPTARDIRNDTINAKMIFRFHGLRTWQSQSKKAIVPTMAQMAMERMRNDNKKLSMI